MVKDKSHLPISSYARLNQLRRLKELHTATLADDGSDAPTLTPAQKVMADQVFGSASLDTLRRQAIREMVSSGYLDEEIKMMLADPESPYSILIEGLKPESIPDTIRAVIRKVKKNLKDEGQGQAIADYIQVQHLHHINVLHILFGDYRNGNIANINIIFLNEKKEQI